MNERFKLPMAFRLRLCASAAAMCVILLAAAPSEAVVIADSQAEFSGTQGQDGWRYGYNASGTFTPSPTFNAGTNMFGHGTNGVWSGIGNVRHVREGSHPDTSAGTFEALRRWTSDYTGWVKITGDLSKFDVLGGDGVIGAIRVNGNAAQPFTQFLRGSDGIGVNYTQYINVNAGDTLDFSVHYNVNNSNDSTRFTAQIATVAPHVQIFDAARDFNPSAAANTAASQWQYVSLGGVNDLSDARSGSYTYLTTAVGNSTAWEGVTGFDVLKTAARFPVVAKNTTASILRPFGTTDVSPHALVVHPDGPNGAGIGWRAPADGFVDIDGFLKLAATNLDPNFGQGGIEWFLDLNNKAGVLDSGFLNTTNGMDSFSLTNVFVHEGDMLWLGVLPGANNGGDLTQISMQVAFTPIPEPAAIVLWFAALGIGLTWGGKYVRRQTNRDT